MKLLLAAIGCLLGCLPSAVAAEPACLLLMAADSGKVLLQQGAQCDVRNSPASTFKIALGVIGYDAGVLSDAHTPAWPYKEEYAAWVDSWKTTIDPTSWQRESVVWYSREITRRLGAERFQRYVDLFDYGNRDLSGDPGQNNGLSKSWISSSLKISPREEAAFLRKFLNKELPVAREAVDRTIAIVPQYPLPDAWTAHGKTGAGFQSAADGKLDRDRQFGWFVGWAQKDDRRLIFATLIKDDAKIAGPAGLRARDELLAGLPRLLNGFGF
jgi:beta-lactamase class D